MNQSIVVVGGGQAAAAFAGKLRALGVDRPITLVCQEPVLPYQRPPLSKKYLTGEAAFDRLLLKPPAWYEVNAVDVRLGTAVTAIDRGGHAVALSDGTRLTYGTLALATGARPLGLAPGLGGNFAGVYTMRSKTDADALAGEFRPGRRLLVIGGGYIGLETAAVARTLGLEVTVIELADRILKRVAAPETARLIAALHARHDVAIRESTALTRLIGEDGRVRAALIAGDEEIPVDTVIVGIGAAPDTRLAAGAGLAIDNGIAVDERGRTSDPDIYAFGDCASFPWRGERIRLESVQNAYEQAEATAVAVAGGDGVYDPHPWFWSDQYDAKLQIAGLNRGYDAVLAQHGPREHSHAVWYFRQGAMVAVDALNHPAAYMTAKKLIETGRRVTADDIAGRPLKDLLK